MKNFFKLEMSKKNKMVEKNRENYTVLKTQSVKKVRIGIFSSSPRTVTTRPSGVKHRDIFRQKFNGSARVRTTADALPTGPR